MQTQRLGQRQLFNMLRGNLEKRIIKLYSETKDVPAVIEYAVALLVRHSLTVVDFSFMCRDLIREVYLTAEPGTVMRRFSILFEGYFNRDEWKTIVARLYKNENDYIAATAEARRYQACLKEKDPTRKDELANHQFIMKSIFKGSNGRKHTWTLKNAHPTKNQEEITGSLKLLTMLSIFETNGVRKFTEFVEFFRDATAPDLHYAEEQEELPEANEEPAVKNAETKDKKELPASTLQQTPQQEKQNLEKVPTLKEMLSEEGRQRLEKAAVSQTAEPSSGTVKGSPPKQAVGNARSSSTQNSGPSAAESRDAPVNAFGKSKEDIELGREERRLNKKLAKFFQKRGKK